MEIEIVALCCASSLAWFVVIALGHEQLCKKNKEIKELEQELIMLKQMESATYKRNIELVKENMKLKYNNIDAEGNILEQ